MDAAPRWVKAIWATPARRLALSTAVLAVAAWMLISALWDPDEFFQHRRSSVGFVAAPLIVLMFGLQAVEARRGLLHKRNSPGPGFHRLRKRLQRGGAAPPLRHFRRLVAPPL